MRPISGEVLGGYEYKFVPEGAGEKEKIQGKIKFTEPIDILSTDVPSFVKFTKTEGEVDEFQITLTDGEESRDDIRIYTLMGCDLIPILAAPTYFAVERTLNDEVKESLEIIQEQYGKQWTWGFYSACRRALCFEKFVDVLNILASESNKFNHAQFRSATGYFAKRIGGSSPQKIQSIDVLSDRIDYWNSKSQLKNESVPEVLSEKLGRNWYRVGLGSERQDLLGIGFDPIGFDPEWQSVFPATWLAHITLSEGVKEAKKFVRSRPIPDKGSYKELIDGAGNAKHKEGIKWAAVLARTGEEEKGDFREAAFNYVEQTAKEYRGKGKFPPLLHASAKILIPNTLPSSFRQNVDFQHEIAIGHCWRRDKAFDKEMEAFERAKRVARGSKASGYEFNAFLFVEAEASMTHATAKSVTDSESKFKLYQNGIESILRVAANHNIPDWKVEQHIEFLKKQQRSHPA